ncbi:MAG: hypothetical protein AAB420_03760 [Patescibacteria group bacterium]
MATVHEKIVAMLATVQEMRKMLKSGEKADDIVALVEQRLRISQKDLLATFPQISSRTIRRRLDTLIRQSRLLRRKEGKEVYYLAYPQK